jgi:Zn finger protein HypA/HybF involved in hydrogenase expression
MLLTAIVSVKPDMGWADRAKLYKVMEERTYKRIPCRKCKKFFIPKKDELYCSPCDRKIKKEIKQWQKSTHQ